MSQKTLPPPEQVCGWDVRHVADWLRHNDMPEFIMPFRMNNVDGTRLLDLDENTLRSFSTHLPQTKIIKLLDKVRKSKKEKSSLFNKLRPTNRNSNVPAVPDRDYNRQPIISRIEDEEEGWGSDFSDSENEDNYEPPPDPTQSEVSRYPHSNQSQFNTNAINDEDELYFIPVENPHETHRQPFNLPNEINEDDDELYIVPVENPHETHRQPFDDDEVEDEYLAPVEAVEDAAAIPPARPPKTNKDFLGKPSGQRPQMLALAPTLNSVSSDVPPRPPARRDFSPSRNRCIPHHSVSPMISPSYRPEIQNNFVEDDDTYEAPTLEEDCDGTYAVPEEQTPNRLPQPLPSIQPKSPNKFRKPQSKYTKMPPPKNPYNSTNNKPAIPPPIVRYPKTDTTKPAIETPDESSSTSSISKMKHVFEQGSPTLPRKDVYNSHGSFLHKRLPQPPLPPPSKCVAKESPTKESKPISQPYLPPRKPAQKPPSSTASDSCSKTDTTKVLPSPTQRPSPVQRPSPAQRRAPSPAKRNTPTPSVQIETVPKPSATRTAASTMNGYPWYHPELPRDKALKSLEEFRRDGAFLVRESKRGGPKNPFTLSLWYNNQVRNLQMRRRDDGKYALGSMKDGEQAFDSPVELVEFHQNNPLILANSEGKTKLKQCCPVY
ncbi:uncharacterized protein [Antedon mediterranea]|uniref:uncharacterized protein isoform X2 n=1 Tax=Antedon mediterranea TaxID=105859 RepID=UPI003AF53F35